MNTHNRASARPLAVLFADAESWQALEEEGLLEATHRRKSVRRRLRDGGKKTVAEVFPGLCLSPGTRAAAASEALCDPTVVEEIRFAVFRRAIRAPASIAHVLWEEKVSFPRAKDIAALCVRFGAWREGPVPVDGQGHWGINPQVLVQVGRRGLGPLAYLLARLASTPGETGDPKRGRRVNAMGDSVANAWRILRPGSRRRAIEAIRGGLRLGSLIPGASMWLVRHAGRLGPCDLMAARIALRQQAIRFERIRAIEQRRVARVFSDSRLFALEAAFEAAMACGRRLAKELAKVRVRELYLEIRARADSLSERAREARVGWREVVANRAAAASLLPMLPTARSAGLGDVTIASLDPRWSAEVVAGIINLPEGPLRVAALKAARTAGLGRPVATRLLARPVARIARRKVFIKHAMAQCPDSEILHLAEAVLSAAAQRSLKEEDVTSLHALIEWVHAAGVSFHLPVKEEGSSAVHRRTLGRARDRVGRQSPRRKGEEWERGLRLAPLFGRIIGALREIPGRLVIHGRDCEAVLRVAERVAPDVAVRCRYILSSRPLTTQASDTAAWDEYACRVVPKDEPATHIDTGFAGSIPEWMRKHGWAVTGIRLVSTEVTGYQLLGEESRAPALRGVVLMDLEHAPQRLVDPISGTVLGKWDYSLDAARFWSRIEGIVQGLSGLGLAAAPQSRRSRRKMTAALNK